MNRADDDNELLQAVHDQTPHIVAVVIACGAAMLSVAYSCVLLLARG
jgi:hypothetical protein